MCIFEKIQDDVHNRHMTDRHQAPAYPLRLPAELKEAITKAAQDARRSFNAEVTERLAASLVQASAPTTDYPEEVVIAVQDEMDEQGGTFTEALARLVLAGYSGGGTLLTIKAARKTSYGAILQALDTSKTVVPPSTRVLFARDRRPTDEKNRAQGPALDPSE